MADNQDDDGFMDDILKFQQFSSQNDLCLDADDDDDDDLEEDEDYCSYQPTETEVKPVVIEEPCPKVEENEIVEEEDEGLCQSALEALTSAQEASDLTELITEDPTPIIDPQDLVEIEPQPGPSHQEIYYEPYEPGNIEDFLFDSQEESKNKLTLMVAIFYNFSYQWFFPNSFTICVIDYGR